jgi:AcrR family transcriptional regulator
MPRQLHDKAGILDACCPVFARHGYQATSMAMLAQAAAVSKALLFHHFTSKAGVYLALVDRSVALGRAAMDPAEVAACRDFFEARERLSLMKYRFCCAHPTTYRVLMEAYLDTPEELCGEMQRRQDALAAERRELWRRLFRHVPLRRGVKRSEAFELVMLAMEAFERRYLGSTTTETAVQEANVRRFLAERRRFLAMIRCGIQAQDALP